MGTFDGMTLDVSGIDTLDILTGLRLVYSDSTYEIYDQFHTYQDVAIQAGVTVNLVTLDYQFVVMVNYGHYGSTVAVPTRRAIGVELTWGSGASSGGVISVDTASGTVQSGNAIPPTIFTWNLVGQTVFGTFLGKDVAFVENGMWMKNPNSSGVTDRFAVRFEPAREDISYSRMMRGATYSGSWVNDDTNGTRVRPDQLGFHTSDGGAWYFWGTGWWMQTNQPSSSADWRYKNDGAHADAGVLPFCQLYQKGGEAIWVNTAYRFIIKQMAARYLGQFPDPNAGYANQYYNDYQHDAMRSKGRIVSSGVWIWRALDRMNTYSSNDTEVNDLAVAMAQRTINIFQHIYNHIKPYALAGEPAPIFGFWQWNQGANEQPHPEAGWSLPVNTKMDGIKHWMGGLMWIGFFHLWEGLRELGLSSLIEFTRVRLVMDFIAQGYGSYPDGLFDVMIKWKESHGFAPPNPIPPAWATAPYWPTPILYTVGGYGWSWEYQRQVNNTNNADLQYLSFPSTATTGQQVAVFEFMLREGMVTDPTELTKLNEIISDYRHLSYTFHLGDSIDILVNETAAATETRILENLDAVASNIDKVQDSTAQLSEAVVADLTTSLKVVVPDFESDENQYVYVEISEGAVVDFSITKLVNEQLEVTIQTSMESADIFSLTFVIDEDMTFTDLDIGNEVLTPDFVVVPQQANSTLAATGTSVLTAISGTGTSVLPALIGN